jgi:hypothetical protein
VLQRLLQIRPIVRHTPLLEDHEAHARTARELYGGCRSVKHELTARFPAPAGSHRAFSLRQHSPSSIPLRNNQYFMIEYVLLPGVNDAEKHAQELAELLAPVRCLVNVIPHNPRPGSPWRAPTSEETQRFLGWLTAAGQPCRQRVTRGREELAACGQLGHRERVG